MKQPGQVILFRFPHADLAPGKLRPALLLASVPGGHDDWLICMISSRLRHCIPDFDEIVREQDTDFAESGLKAVSAIRIARLAVVQGDVLLGTIGSIAPSRLQRIKQHLAAWITSSLTDKG